MGGVDEPGDPRFDESAFDVDLNRCLDVVGLPHRIAVRWWAFEEYVEVSARPLPRAEPCPVAGSDIGCHRSIQCGFAGCRGAACLLRGYEFPVQGQDVPAPVRQSYPQRVVQAKALPRNRLDVVSANGQPSPHGAFGYPQCLCGHRNGKIH